MTHDRPLEDHVEIVDAGIPTRQGVIDDAQEALHCPLSGLQASRWTQQSSSWLSRIQTPPP
jgi:hypothetical protein